MRMDARAGAQHHGRFLATIALNASDLAASLPRGIIHDPSATTLSPEFDSMADEATNGAASAETPTPAQFNVQKIYLKNVSFESPNAPMVFNEQATPQLQLNLNQKVMRFDADLFEVVLSITLTCTIDEKTAYLAEVDQAGVFGLSGFDATGLDMMLATHCPNVLFPYARQALGEMISLGGFPPFLLQPLNFEGIYAENLRRRMEEGQVGALPPAGNA
jgi:preprotein translocase subunit SecB